MSATGTRRGWSADLRAWDSGQRREASVYVFVLSVIVLASTGILWFMLGPESMAGALTAFLVVLALLLLFQLALFVAKPRAASAAAAEAGTMGATGAASAAVAPTVLTLKCGECGTVFDLPDPGTRPLYHACPGCGAEGVLRGEAQAAAAAEDLAAAMPPAGSEAFAPPESFAPPPPAKPKRRLKLRCPACQTVFTVDDFGSRPLKHECPGCGRAGELR